MKIPEACLKQSIAIIGRTGSGKTYTAKGLVERILADQARVCIIDPLGRELVQVEGSTILATPAGVEALGSDFRPLPKGAALRSYWLDRLPEGERKVLEVITNAWPGAVERDEISNATGYKRSTRDAYLQRLATRQLIIAERGTARASEVLFK